jgi:hypothetical protein
VIPTSHQQAKAREERADVKRQAEAGELVLLSPDEARFPRVPTRGAILGVKGHRPTVGTRDCKDLLDVGVFWGVNVLSVAVPSDTPESPARAKQKTGLGKTRRVQEAFARHLRHVGRLDPKDKHQRVVSLSTTPPGMPVRLWRRPWPITPLWSGSGCPAPARS